MQGRIAEVLVDQGSLVKTGQLLVRLDDEDLAQQVLMATASISSSEATLVRFRAEISQAKSSFAKTEADLGRMQKLIVANSISQSEFEQSQESFELAKSGLLRAEANLLEAEQQVKLNRETLKFQETRLADTKILAPFDGLVIERERDAFHRFDESVFSPEIDGEIFDLEQRRVHGGRVSAARRRASPAM
jgi:HlyD family secretion protein